MASSVETTSSRLSVRGKKRLLCCAVLTIGLLLAGCLDFFGDRDRPQQPPVYELQPYYIRLLSGVNSGGVFSANTYIYFTGNDAAGKMWLPDANMLRPDFKVYIDGTEIDNFTVSVAIRTIVFYSEGVYPELREAYNNKKETYDIKIVYAANPSRPITFTLSDTGRTHILRSFTFQQTVIPYYWSNL